MNSDIQLLVTFTTKSESQPMIATLQSTYDIIGNKIFILENVDNPEEYILSYNINLNGEIDVDNIPFNTISCHRKKDTNTIYTINALNNLIMKLNNGTLDKHYHINWKNYENCILVIKNKEFKIIHTKLKNILELT